MKPAPILLLALSLALAGCETATYDPHVAAVDNQLLARSIQTRELSAERYQDVVTAVIGTLQDYHFRIVEVDPDLGTLTAYQMTDARSGRQSRPCQMSGWPKSPHRSSSAARRSAVMSVKRRPSFSRSPLPRLNER